MAERGEMVHLRLRLDCPQGISIAELGVLLTGVNRALNEWAVGESAVSGKEPTAVSARVTSVSEGSVIVDALLEFFDSQVAQPGFLQNMLANASFELLGKLSVQIKRALTRTKDPHVDPVRVEPTYVEQPSPSLQPPDPHPIPVLPSRLGSDGDEATSKTILVEVSVGASGVTRTVSVKATVPVNADRVAIDLRGPI